MAEEKKRYNRINRPPHEKSPDSLGAKKPGGGIPEVAADGGAYPQAGDSPQKGDSPELLAPAGGGIPEVAADGGAHPQAGDSPQNGDSPELLAPAGDLNTALAAFEHGADAVYCGLKKFNARERSENLSFQDLSRLLRYARKNNKRVYVTFNTLIKDSEIREAYTLLEQVVSLYPDGIIVQDMGILYLLRNNFPHVPVHASTQMGIHNSAGAVLLEQLGVERIILERQITIDEIKEIREKTSIKLEVFIHGSLCCSLSGVCLFSSWLGGWSGNRGKCKQPCRRRYYSKTGNGFFFSPHDLYSLEDMETLKRLGICSFKIEGRLKKPDYVVPAVTAYRMMLDTPVGQEHQKLSQAKSILSQSGGRFWSSGFRDRNSFTSIIDYKKMGVSGIFLGKIDTTEKNGFFITPNLPIYLEDELRVQPSSGEEGPSFFVTKIAGEGGKRSGEGQRDERPSGRKPSGTKIPAQRKGFIYCDKTVPEQGLVYKIGHRPKDYLGSIARIEPYERCLFLNIDIRSTGITVGVLGGSRSKQWKQPTAVPPARNRPLLKATVEQEFKKVAVEGIDIGKVTTTIEDRLYLQQRDVRNVRQAFNDWLTEEREFFLHQPPSLPPRPLSVSPSTGRHTTVRHGREPVPKHSRNIIASDIGNADTQTQEIILPAFCPEDKLEELKKKIHTWYQSGIRRFRVTSLYGFTLLDHLTDITIVTSYPLPATNRYAFTQLFLLGAETVQIWIELEKAVVSSLSNRFKDRSEVYIFGRPPLLQTRAAIPVQGTIRDGRGIAFIVKKEAEVTAVYPHHPFAIDYRGESSVFIDLKHAKRDEKPTSDFNFHHELV